MHWRYWTTVVVTLFGSVFVLAVMGFVSGVVLTTCLYRITNGKKLKSEENRLSCVHEYETIELESKVTAQNTENQSTRTKRGVEPPQEMENEEGMFIYAEARSTEVPRYLTPKSKKKKKKSQSNTKK